MPYVIEWKSWTEKDYRGNPIYKATAKVNPSIDSEEWLEEAISTVYSNYGKLCDKTLQKLGRDMCPIQDRDIIHELQDWLAKELREVYGRNAGDASHKAAIKSVDMVRIAEKHNLTPGSDADWELKVLEMIKDGEA